MRPLLSTIALSLFLTGSGSAHSGWPIDTSQVEAKLDRLVIGKIELEAANLSVAVDMVRAKSREADGGEDDPSMKGIRIGYERRRAEEPVRLITLKLDEAKLGDVLEEIAKQANRTLEVFEDGVVLRRPSGPLEFEGLVTRTYRVPPDFLWVHAGGDAGAVDDPFAAGAPPRVKKTAREVLEANGVAFPEGATAHYSPSAGGVVMRNTSENHELFEALLTWGGEGYYQASVRIRSDVYDVPSKLARWLARHAETGPGGDFGMREVRRALDLGEATLVASPGIITRSGQRAKVQSGWECPFVKGFKLEEGQQRAELGSKFVGTQLEVDPVIGADGETIELNIAISLSRGEPTFRRVTILSPATGGEAEVDAVDLDSAELTTAMVSKSGQPTFVGVLSNDVEAGRALVAFVTASIATSHYEPPLPE